MDVIQCQQCGGIVVYDAKVEHARCLFCASVALQPCDLLDELPTPECAIGFDVDDLTADAEFRRWAASSRWYPKELRKLRVELGAMWLPAWRFDADVDTHWAGLEPAPTKSHVRPVSGNESQRCRALVPASLGLRRDELEGLAPFDESAAIDWIPEHAHCPWEAPALSRGGALRAAREIFEHQRSKTVRRRHGLTRCRVSIALSNEASRLLMMPIYIGSFRYRDRPWRFVINGHSGKVIGKAPLDRTKVALVVIAALLLAALATWLWDRSPDPEPEHAMVAEREV